MMRLSNVKMTTTVQRSKLLQTVRENLARHEQIVAEAKVGYLARAKQALKEQLLRAEAGNTPDLTFRLAAPQDHSEVYRTVVEMLAWTTDESVTLQADEFRQLVLDQWDWTDGFYLANSNYSETASRFGGVKSNWQGE